MLLCWAVLSRVQDFSPLVPRTVTPRTVIHQAPLSVGFPRQVYWSRLLFPTPGDLPNPGIEPMSPALAGGFFTAVPPGKPLKLNTSFYFIYYFGFLSLQKVGATRCCGSRASHCSSFSCEEH